jgi:hypothetical protein
MSVQIKSLSNTAPTADNSLTAPQNDNFNIIPGANITYDLYTAPNDSANERAAIVKSIRLINTSAASTVKVNLYFNRPNSSGQNRRRLLITADTALLPGFSLIDESEITLEPGDKIQGKADTANVIQYVISGVERDVT